MVLKFLSLMDGLLSKRHILTGRVRRFFRVAWWLGYKESEIYQWDFSFCTRLQI